MGRFSKRVLVEARWGHPFWDLVRDFADQGLDRRTTARALGMHYVTFYKMLAENPEHDPFPSYHVVSAYTIDTGEPFRDALERLIAEGAHISLAARSLGYARAVGLRYAMAVRGIELEFPPMKPKPRKKRVRHNKPGKPRAKGITAAPNRPAGNHPWRRSVAQHEAKS